MKKKTEYRLIHELGRQFATPMIFVRREDAMEALEGQREFSKKIGQEDVGKGWRVESRTVTEWEREYTSA